MTESYPFFTKLCTHLYGGGYNELLYGWFVNLFHKQFDSLRNEFCKGVESLSAFLYQVEKDLSPMIRSAPLLWR